MVGRELPRVQVGELDLRFRPIEALGVHVFDVNVVGAQRRQQHRIESAAFVVRPAVSLVVGMQHQDALIVKIGGETGTGNGEEEKTEEPAKHGDLNAASSGAACVFSLRSLSYTG